MVQDVRNEPPLVPKAEAVGLGAGLAPPPGSWNPPEPATAEPVLELKIEELTGLGADLLGVLWLKIEGHGSTGF